MNLMFNSLFSLSAFPSSFKKKSRLLGTHEVFLFYKEFVTMAVSSFMFKNVYEFYPRMTTWVIFFFSRNCIYFATIF